MITRTRINYVDIMKGIGIVLVVLGHTMLTPDIKRYIYSFHMPLFFFISGYVFKNKQSIKNTDFIKNKAKRLLIPYVMFVLISMPLTIKQLGINPQKIINSFLLYGETSWNTPIWFLFSMFITSLIYFYIDKLNDNHKNSIVIILVAIGFIMIKLNIKVPLQIISSLIGLAFFKLGNSHKKEKFTNFISKPLIIILMGIIGGVVGVFFNSNVNMVGNTYGNIIYFFIASITNIYFVMGISINIKENCLLEYLGRKSLLIMGMHYLVFFLEKGIIYIFIKKNIMTLQNNLLSIVYMLTTILLIVLLDRATKGKINDFIFLNKSS